MGPSCPSISLSNPSINEGEERVGYKVGQCIQLDRRMRLLPTATFQTQHYLQLSTLMR